MAEFQKNLWAPWRMAYIRTLADDSAGGCFLCRYAADAASDAANHVIARTSAAIVVLNRFPYTNGHLLISPLRHEANLSALTEAEARDINRLLADSLEALRSCLRAQGFNVGMNIGHCAGAGLPDHLHWHVVPRWGGDTNYMAVIGDLRVIPDSLDENYKTLRAWFEGARRGPTPS